MQKIVLEPKFSLIVMMAMLSANALGQTINEDLKILPNDGEFADNFGNSIAIGDGILGVGARNSDDDGSRSGSVYIFDRITGNELLKITLANANAGDLFGSSIDIYNNVIAIGASGSSEIGNNAGSIHLFDATTFMRTGGFLPNTDECSFGSAVAMDGQYMAVSAPFDDSLGLNSGAVYTYNLSTNSSIAKILPVGTAGVFGTAIALENDILAVGAPGALGTGSVSVYRVSTNTLVRRIVPVDGQASDRFGSSVSLSGGILAIGSPNNDTAGSNVGAVYLYNALSGPVLSKITPTNGDPNLLFGASVDQNAGLLAVGGPADPSQSGSAYLYEVPSGILIANLSQSDPAGFDSFGISVALDSDFIFVGSSNDDDNGTNSGSVYRFMIPSDECPADLTGDGSLDFFDVSAFLAAFSVQDPVADFAGEGNFDFFDVSAFLAAFSAGCP